MGVPMSPVEEMEQLPPDFWEYVDRISGADLGGYDLGNGDIEYGTVIPRDVTTTSCFDRTILMSFSSWVIYRDGPTLHDHFLLDLPRVYGLRE